MRKSMSFMVAALMLLIALPAQADTWAFDDDVKHWQGWGTYSENKKDVIGIPDILGGEAYTNNNQLRGVKLFFTADKYENMYNTLSSGDLFINTNDDNAWDYVVKLNSDLSAEVFEFQASYTDPNAYDLGFSSSGDYRDNHPAWANVLGDAIASASWSGLPGFPGAGNIGEISIAGLDLNYDKLTLGYTVSCANDVIMADSFSQTPIPGAVWLLGSGLLGLIGLRRKAANKA